MFDYQLMTEDVKEMNMTQLTHNQFFIKDGEAWYRDFEREISCRNLVREIAVNLCIWEENSPEMEDDEAFDESILDYLQYGTNDQEGVLAMYYSAMWGMAEVRAWYMEEKAKVLKVNDFVKIVGDNNVAHGFREDALKPSDFVALVHSEVSEILEEFRDGRKATETYYRDDGKPEGVPAELADVVIRCFDMADYYKIDLEAAITEKYEFNKTRPYKHGKQF